MRRLVPLLIAAAAVSTVTACSDTPDPTPSAAAPSQTAPTAPPVPPGDINPSTAGSAPLPMDDAGPTEVPNPKTANPSSAALARARAAAFMRAFSSTEQDQQSWWKGVAGFFTPASAAIYQTTDVANVPVHHVKTGTARLLPRSTAYRAEIAVDTDNGTYTVILIRTDENWFVDRATPPG